MAAVAVKSGERPDDRQHSDYARARAQRMAYLGFRGRSAARPGQADTCPSATQSLRRAGRAGSGRGARPAQPRPADDTTNGRPPVPGLGRQAARAPPASRQPPLPPLPPCPKRMKNTVNGSGPTERRSELSVRRVRPTLTRPGSTGVQSGIPGGTPTNN